MPDRRWNTTRPARAAGLILLCLACGTLAGWLTGRTFTALGESESGAWRVGRAAGVTAYLLLVLLVLLGLVLAHPWSVRLRWPSPATRIRLHASLAAFAFTFTVLHVVVLATDEHAGVGWAGALLPLASQYRPLAVTLGVLGLYSGLAAGVTAALAGRLPGRVWLPVHRIAGISLVAVWAHSLLAGTDAPALAWMYASTAAVVLVLGASRYLARSPRDRLDQLTLELRAHSVSAVPDREATP